MELFKHRPLCLCCGLFLLFSCLATRFSAKQMLAAALALLVCLALFAVAALIFKSKRHGFLCLMLAAAFVLAALANNLFRMELPSRVAENYTGERYVEMDVICCEHSTEYSSSYVVDITDIDGKSVSVRALAVLGFGTEEIRVGDTIFATVELCNMDARILGQTGESRTDREDVLLVAVAYSADGAAISRFDRSAPFFEKLLSENGVRVMIEELRKGVFARLERCLGKETGALSAALLTGDRSGVETELVRDFRRSGAAHLFAVSGLHVSILLGAIELMLRRLRVRKAARCALLSVSALGLLCLTAFSMSAMRAVFMLMLVYLAFMISEENDPPTSLFVAVTLIILISPYAVYELGMWMSFLATLGIVTVLPLAQRAISVKKKGGRVRIALLRAARAAALTGIGTVAANMLLLPVSWAIFGEISAMAIPTNIILSPLAAVYLVLSALAAVLSGVPLLTTLIRYAALGVSSAMRAVVELFSGLEIASVSLRYPFAKWIVLVFCVVILILLVIRIRKKLLFVIPPIALVLSFGVAIVCFNLTNPTSLSYSGNGHREVISICDDGELAIIDMSDGYYTRFRDSFEEAAVYGATEVETVVLTSISSVHVSSLDYFLSSHIVRQLYIPELPDEQSRELSLALARAAERSGTRAYLYGADDTLELIDGVGARIISESVGDKRANAAFVAYEDRMLGYVDAFICGGESEDEVNRLVSLCDTVIIGNNGTPKQRYGYDVDADARLIYCSQELADLSNIRIKSENVYLNTKKILNFRIAMD